MYNAIGSTAAVAMANAHKMIGSIVCVEPDVFVQILKKTDNPLVVYSPASFLTKYKYMTSYKGLTFFAKSKVPLMISPGAELITAQKIVIPESF